MQKRMLNQRALQLAHETVEEFSKCNEDEFVTLAGLEELLIETYIYELARDRGKDAL